MFEKLCLVTDAYRKIPYNAIITLYDYDLYTKEELSKINLLDYSLVIIDINNSEEKIFICNTLRELDPSIPLLIINTFLSPSHYLYFTKLKGYGITKTFQWSAQHPNEILRYINETLHPEYPSKTSDIAFVIPVYNEESRFINVLNFVEQLKILLNRNLINTQIYFVNDGSRDNTKKLINTLIEKESNGTEVISNNPFISINELNYNTRKAGTYIQGIKSINSDYIIFVDADNSFKIEDISKMINIISVGYYDIIVATKDLTAKNRPLVRRLMSFFKRLLTKPLLPKGINDSQTGLKILTSTSAKYILPYLHENTGLAIDLEMMYIAKKLNFRSLQLPVECIDRDGSHVNLIKDSISFIKNIIKLLTVNRNVDFHINKYWEVSHEKRHSTGR